MYTIMARFPNAQLCYPDWKRSGHNHITIRFCVLVNILPSGIILISTVKVDSSSSIAWLRHHSGPWRAIATHYVKIFPGVQFAHLYCVNSASCRTLIHGKDCIVRARGCVGSSRAVGGKWPSHKCGFDRQPGKRSKGQQILTCRCMHTLLGWCWHTGLHHFNNPLSI